MSNQKDQEKKISDAKNVTKNSDKKSQKKLDKLTELSAEDQKLKDDLAQHVLTIISFTGEKLSPEELSKQKESILFISKEINEATASMTAIPKPLKFLREHIPALRNYYSSRTDDVNYKKDGKTAQQISMNEDDDIILPVAGLPTTTLEPWANQECFADLLSIVSMIIPNEVGLVLKYRCDAIKGDYEKFPLDSVFKWGIAYVQSLCAELSKEYQRISYHSNIDGDDDDNDDVDQNNSSMDSLDDGSNDKNDEEFDDLAPTIINKANSSINSIAGELPQSKLSKSLSTNKQSVIDNNNNNNSSVDDKKDKKDENKKDENKNDDKNDKKGPLGGKKELTDEEKAKIEAEELKIAKQKVIIPKPVTTASLLEIRTLAVRFLPHLFEHGCEVDAVDMLFETDNIIAVGDFVDEANSAEVLPYIEQSNKFSSDLSDQQLVCSLLVNTYMRLKQYSNALVSALHITPYSYRKRALAQIFYTVRDVPHVQLALAHILSQYTSHTSYLCSDSLDDVSTAELSETDAVYINIIEDFPIITDYRAVEALQKGSCGVLSQEVLNDLGVTKGKSRDDVCRVDEGREDPYEWFAVGLANTGTKILDVLDSTKASATSSIAAKTDQKSQSSNLILSKALSTGMIYIGDVEEGYSLVDPYLNPVIEDGNAAHKEQSILGGIVATALCGAGITNDFNAGIALLSDYVTDSETHSLEIRTTAIYSLGISYLGTHNEELRELFVPLLFSDELDDNGKAICALALGLVFLGSCDNTLAEVFIATMSELKPTPHAMRIVSLACGFLVFNNQHIGDEIGVTFANLSWTIENEMDELLLQAQKRYFAAIVDLSTHVGSGDVTLVQSLLRVLSLNEKNNDDDDDQDDDEDEAEEGSKGDKGKDATATTTTTTTPAAATTTPGATGATTAPVAEKQKKTVQVAKNIVNETLLKQINSASRSLSVLTLAFVSLGDELTQQCTSRVLQHLLECGSSEVRAAVPLAMAMLNISSPAPALTDHLVRLSHDVSAPLAINATLAMGLTAAGSNNSRSMAAISSFISETHDKAAIQISRISQGLVMLGQGTLTLSTTLYNNNILNTRSTVALLLILTQMIETNFGLCSKLHTWSILPVCSRPKVLVTKLVDNDNLEDESTDVQIPVKMGQVQGGVILGRRTVLSGIQVTHTPVIINVGHYVQVDDDDYTALSHAMEGTVLVTKAGGMGQ